MECASCRHMVIKQFEANDENLIGPPEDCLDYSRASSEDGLACETEVNE